MTERVICKLELWDTPSTSKFDKLLHGVQQSDLLKRTVASVIEHVISNLPVSIPSAIPNIAQHIFEMLKDFRHYKFERTPSSDGAADNLEVTYAFEGDNTTEKVYGHYKCSFEEVDKLESFQSGQIWTNYLQVKVEDASKIFRIVVKDIATHGNIRENTKTGTEYFLTETDLPEAMHK